MKKLNKKGFTLAELLVVVAIIAVLVAVAIPTFSAATDKAQYGVEQANARSAYAEAKIYTLSSDKDDLTGFTNPTYDGITYKVTKSGGTYTVTLETGLQIKSVVFDSNGDMTINK